MFSFSFSIRDNERDLTSKAPARSPMSEQQQTAADVNPRQTDSTKPLESLSHESPSSSPPEKEREAPQEPPKSSQEQLDHDEPKRVKSARTSALHERYKAQKEKIKTKSQPPGGYDPTPLPDAPQGYTVKFTFHRAFNLPIADLHLHSSDPFIQATLIADVPKRHKEDPLLTRRTRTLRRTTEPAWEEDWIVANVPASGFLLKCRLYDEDWPDHDDRLGNVTIKVPSVSEDWGGFGPEGKIFEVKKRAGSKRAYLYHGLRSALCWGVPMTPTLQIGIEVLGKSDPPHAQMYTVAPTTWVKHFSPMIGRLMGVKVNKDEHKDADPDTQSDDGRSKKFDFQANEIQLSGPVPEKLYHRYVEFRPMIGRMFSSKGVRGRILNAVLHKQHRRIYNFDSTTEYGSFEPCSEEAALQFLKMAHFDEGGRIFTYVITLDGRMRFTETGKEFGIDLLSKHTMHSDVATYIACSGEFFIRRLARPRHHHHHHSRVHSDSQPHHDDNNHISEGASSSASSKPPTLEKTHPPREDIPDGPPNSSPPPDPHLYQLIIDNDSGTYRPDQSVLPKLREFLSRNFPGLDVRAMHCDDDELKEMKKAQLEIKKREGPKVRMVLNRSPSASSFSSDDESRLGDIMSGGDDTALRSKKERAFDLVQDPQRWREVMGFGIGGGISSLTAGGSGSGGGGGGGQATASTDANENGKGKGNANEEK
ncbi:hypothetical protein QBC35DRAFT_501668 [Podospora australis]|uniref:C2 domain-containing protein n=1 Tax=Podospora australis TaxID=1536484 RepID=A0AAN7AH13_9PEZI|nr:hypothetical protein QBC35DRAFT_501668 [Podospora australis]